MNIKSVAVLGSGLMGSGIAATIARNNYSVSMFSHSQDAEVRMKSYIEHECVKGRLSETQKESIWTNLNILSYENLNELTKCDLVIESTHEDKAFKKNILKTIGKIASNMAIVCTNTSTLSVSELAAEYKKPGRFAGMHFFSPVASMGLIEVVKGFLTEDSVIDDLMQFGRMIGKEPVQVNDNPGFVLNRIIAPYISEAVNLLDRGIAEAADIDCIIKHCMGAQVGPLQLGDNIGLDVIKKCSDILFDAYKDSKYISNLLNKKYYAKEFGKKSGRGFYTYE